MVALKVRARAQKRPVQPNGVILYRGPSLVNGRPIVVIATGLTRGSANEKTGEMVQTYILADNGQKPTDSLKSGADEAICGDCPHRKGSCYVNVGQGGNMVHDGLMRGIYPVFNPTLHLHLFTDRLVRFGTYGDPAAVPYRVWRLLASVAAGRTGYTHQWSKCDQRLRGLVMASVDAAWQREEAQAMGWRTFRVRLESQPIEKGEFVCPASAEAGKRLTCETCLACHGATASGKGASPVIIAHGSPIGGNYKLRRFEQVVRDLEAQAPSRRVSLSVVS